MAYQALYRAWRPDRFADVVGQEPIITTLVHQIETGHIAHAYLFCGSRGTGKTTTAKVLSRAINCEHPLPGGEPCGTCEACKSLALENSMDVMEIDAASNNGVDDIRELREKIVYPPTVGKYKVYIIDEVHMLSGGAFNALLKTLEEPPAHAVFILATTEPQKLPATILSRCQRFDFKRIPAAVIVGRLRVVLSGIGREADEEALQVIATAAQGGMRDALSLMDMCLAYEDGRLDAKLVREVLGASDGTFLFDFAQALIDGRADRALTAIDEMVREGRDPAVFLKEVIAHIRALLLAKLVKKDLDVLLEVTKEDAARYIAQSKDAPEAALTRRMDLFIAAEGDMKWASQPRAVIELAAVRACHPEREGGDDALIERVNQLEAQVREGVKVPDKADVSTSEKKETPKKKEPVKKNETPKMNGISAEDQGLWEKIMEAFKAKDPHGYGIMTKFKFNGIEGNVLKLSIPRSQNVILMTLQSTGKDRTLCEAASDVLGRQMTAQFVIEGAKAAPSADKPKKQGRDVLEEVFGRDKIINIDEPDI